MNEPLNPDKPASYPRRILLAATGLSPQVVTETVYALAITSPDRFIPTEIHLLTTKDGCRNAELSLLEGDAWLPRLCDEYQLPRIRFAPDHIHVIGDPPLADIRTAQDNDVAADHIVRKVRDLTRDRQAALHVSIAGGRKTMGFYIGYALSLYGRAQDRLSHVLVEPPFESLPEFFYPSPKRRVVRGRDNTPHDASTARVTLATIPFVRLRDGLPKGLLDGRDTFLGAVDAASRVLGPPSLAIDLPKRRACFHGHAELRLPPVQLAFLAWLARRAKAGSEFVVCPSAGAPEMSHRDEYLREYHAIIGEMGYDESTRKRLAGGMTQDFFSQTKSKLHRRIRSLDEVIGTTQAGCYRVCSVRENGRRLYGLELAPDAIRFAESQDD